MQTQVNNSNPQPKAELKHSSIGIASFVMALFVDLLLLISVINSLPALIVVFWILFIASTVLAIVDLNLPNRKKKLPRLALFLGIGLPDLALIIFASIYFYYFC